MKILHTVEFYHPSIGGMQEVVKQLSERLVLLGHELAQRLRSAARDPTRTTPTEFIASPLDRLVRLTRFISLDVVGRTPTSCRWRICRGLKRRENACGGPCQARYARRLR